MYYVYIQCRYRLAGLSDRSPRDHSLMSAFEILEFVMAANCYPKFWLPIESSAERTFSKLKLLKNYLRSTMSQERLNSLAMCNIVRAILDTVDQYRP